METLNKATVEIDPEDLYEQHCGEVFFTIKGNVVFHCTLCVCKYKSYPDYLKHLQEDHYQDYVFEDGKFEYEAIEDIEENEIQAILNVDEKGEEIESESIKIEVHIERTNEKDANENEVLNEFVEIDEENCVYSIDLEKIEIEESLERPQKKVTKRKSTALKERKYKCHTCGFAFTEIFNLRAHLRRHSKEKMFKCTQCPKDFHTRTEQETHMRRHRNERPFVCDECGQSFVTAGALTMHVKRHKNLRNHECTHCQKRFYDTHALKIHLAGHLGERPFHCDFFRCKASFSRKKALAVHKKIHENKREYQCQYCPSSFNQKPGLYSHLKTKHSGCVL